MGKVWDLQQFTSELAIVDDKGISISYEELISIEEKVRETFKKRCLVMILTSNTVGSICAYEAFLNNGFTLLLISQNTPDDTVQKLLSTYRPSILLLSRSLYSKYPFMKQRLSIYDYEAVLTNFTDLYPIHDKLGLLLTTSGSTGSAKFVRQSYDNVVFNAQSFVDCLDMTSSDRTITVLPMHYTYGLSVINASFLVGACMVVTEMSPLEEDFWDFFEEKKVTTIHAVPNTYEMLRHIEIFEEDFPNLRLIVSGGGKLQIDLHDYLAKYALMNNKEFVALYGQCEATALISQLPFSLTIEKEGSIGIPIKGGKMSLIDESDNEIKEPNVQGEICYEGPNVTMGYALSKEDLGNDFEWIEGIKTGDIAYVDDEGFYYITGRLKRYIKMFGHRISLDEIDNLIAETIHIRSVSSGIDDHLVIFITDENEKKAVSDFVLKRFAIVRTAFIVQVIDEFPTNESGKIKYTELFDIAKELV